MVASLSSAVGAWLIPSGNAQLQEVLQYCAPVLGEDALGMKLHAPDRQGLVPHTHDLAR